MLASYLAGIGLGLALIAPIGPQNLYIINAGLSLGVPRVFAATIVTTLCDALLISLGVLGFGVMLQQITGAKLILLAGGVLFLAYLGIQAFKNDKDAMVADVPNTWSPSRMVRRAVSVSLVNPHAILDMTVAIGAAAAAQTMTNRFPFAVGAITASLIWFVFLGVSAAAVRDRLTPGIRLWIERVSGLVFLLFATLLLLELIQEVQ